MKYPNLVLIENLNPNISNSKKIDGKYVPCRACGYPSFRHRVKMAWLVFTGQADALIWPGQ